MSKTEKIVAVKGMNDILPNDSHLWQLFENTAQSVVQSYGFQQIVLDYVKLNYGKVHV